MNSDIKKQEDIVYNEPKYRDIDENEVVPYAIIDVPPL